MSTGSIHAASKTLHKQVGRGFIHQTFTATSEIKTGQPVKLSANGSVEPAAAADEHIGVCTVGGKSGELVTIVVSYLTDSLVKIVGGTASAGDKVTFNGNVDANGVPEVAIAASGVVAKGIVLSGGAADSEIRIGILAIGETVA